MREAGQVEHQAAEAAQTAAQQVGQASPWWFSTLVLPVGAALLKAHNVLMARADAENRARIEELKLQIEKLEKRLDAKEAENRELLQRVGQLEELLRSCPVTPGRSVGQ